MNTETTTASDLASSGIFDISNSGINQIGLTGFAMVMAISLVSSFLISVLYLRFYGSRATGSQIHRAFPLLGLSVSAIFICIQFSLPLSLGLLGALSIVRFRTPIKEPEEIGFIMLVIGASIAISTFSLGFLLILVTFAAIALLIQKYGFNLVARDQMDGMLLLTMPMSVYALHSEPLKTLLETRLINTKVENISKSGDSTVVSYSFNGVKSGDPVDIQLSVSALIPESEVNVYFNKQSTL